MQHYYIKCKSDAMNRGDLIKEAIQENGLYPFMIGYYKGKNNTLHILHSAKAKRKGHRYDDEITWEWSKTQPGSSKVNKKHLALIDKYFDIEPISEDDMFIKIFNAEV